MLTRKVFAALTGSLVLVTLTSVARAQTPPPKADHKDSADDPLLRRYAGSFIVFHEKQAFAEFVLPLGKLEPVPKSADLPPRKRLEPRPSKALEGRHTHLIYYVGRERSPLEVMRNYEEDIKGRGGRLLYGCKDSACGGSPNANMGSEPGLLSVVYGRDRPSEPYGSPGYCAMDGVIGDLHYSAFELGAGRGYASIATYVTTGQGGTCSNFTGATFVTVDVVETQAREQRMVTVKAADMVEAIDSGGKVALYGIYFDSNKAEIKPESGETLEQIGKLLRDKPKLKLLVVGHTDNAGSFSSNMDLSQRRAAAVVSALATRYGVKKDRLTPVGVSFAAPVTSNKTEEGQAKNRRVELVEN